MLEDGIAGQEAGEDGLLDAATDSSNNNVSSSAIEEAKKPIPEEVKKDEEGASNAPMKNPYEKDLPTEAILDASKESGEEESSGVAAAAQDEEKKSPAEVENESP